MEASSQKLSVRQARQVVNEAMSRPKFRDYTVKDGVRLDIRDGDLFMFSGESVVSKLIRAVSGSRYSHVGIAAWWGGRLMILQSDGDGIEARPVSEKIFGVSYGEADRRGLFKKRTGYHGRVDWFPVKEGLVTDAEREALLTVAIKMLGGRFDTSGLFRVFVLTSLGRITGRAELEHHPNSMFCSQFVSKALRDAGWRDPNGEVPDHLTSPEHLLKSKMYADGTTVYDPDQPPPSA